MNQQIQRKITVGNGIVCNNCGTQTIRRKRLKPPANKKSYYFTQWDYCKMCKTIYFEEQFKSKDWKSFQEHEDLFSHAISKDD